MSLCSNQEEKQMQLVYLGKTRTGVFGYFTNGYLAWALSPEQYGESDQWHANYAKSLNFKFVSSVEA
jgi:hypothetical protein